MMKSASGSMLCDRSLYLIRHAESENNARYAHERVCDPTLTKRGHLQAECLAKWMRDVRLKRLVTSPFLRTIQTTGWILRERPQDVHVWHDVFESGGCFNGHDEASFSGAPGLGRDAIPQKVVECMSAGTPSSVASPIKVVVDSEISAAGWWGEKPRETTELTKARARSVADRLAREFEGSASPMGLVIHADFKRELLAVLLENVISTEGIGVIANAAVSQLQYSPSASGNWRLMVLNSVTHLPPRLISYAAH